MVSGDKFRQWQNVEVLTSESQYCIRLDGEHELCVFFSLLPAFFAAVVVHFDFYTLSGQFVAYLWALPMTELQVSWVVELLFRRAIF